MDFQRVAIQQLKAFDRRVVVELAARGLLPGKRIHADDQAFKQILIRRFRFRVEQALHRVRDVGGDQFAFFSGEGRVVGKVDALLHPQRVGLAIGTDVRHRFKHVGLQFQRSGEVIVGQRRVEHLLVHQRRIPVGCLRGIETGFGDLEGVTHDFVGVGLGGGVLQKQ